MFSDTFSAFVTIYQTQPVFWQRAIIGIAVLVAAFAVYAFLKLTGDLIDQVLPARDLPSHQQEILRNVQPVDDATERRVLEAMASLSTQPPRVLPHRRSIEVEIR